MSYNLVRQCADGLVPRNRHIIQLWGCGWLLRYLPRHPLLELSAAKIYTMLAIKYDCNRRSLSAQPWLKISHKYSWVHLMKYKFYSCRVIALLRLVIWSEDGPIVSLTLLDRRLGLKMERKMVGFNSCWASKPASAPSKHHLSRSSFALFSVFCSCTVWLRHRYDPALTSWSRLVMKSFDLCPQCVNCIINFPYYFDSSARMLPDTNLSGTTDDIVIPQCLKTHEVKNKYTLIKYHHLLNNVDPINLKYRRL